MTDKELAEEIERKAAVGDGHVALTDEKWQQIIVALRRGPERDIHAEALDRIFVGVGLCPHCGGDIPLSPSERPPYGDLPEYHGKECYYCHERISAFDSTRGPGGCALCHADEPGVVKWHHSSCVSQRLSEPSGEMVMVPREPTHKMILAGNSALTDTHANWQQQIDNAYRAMLSEASKEAK